MFIICLMLALLVGSYFAVRCVSLKKIGIEDVVEVKTEIEPIKKPRKKKSEIQIVEPDNMVVHGAFTDMKSMLEGLDDTFNKLSLMTCKTQVQKLMKKMGPFIFSFDTINKNPQCDNDGILEQCKLEGFESYGLPTFLFGNIPKPGLLEDDGESFKYLAWAIKTDKVPYVGRRKNCVFYEFGYIFPKMSSKIPEFQHSAYVSVNTVTGEVIAIPVYSSWYNPIRTKDGVRYLHQTGWRYIKMSDRKDVNTAYETVRMFCMLYTMIMRREMGCNIVVTKDNCKATFLVPENKWKDFFKDRVDVEGTNGIKQRIFHSVAAHVRSNGRVVKTHYRGSRDFIWNGYRVCIVMPEKHGAPQASLDLTTYEIPDKITNQSEEHIEVQYDSDVVRPEVVDLSGIFGHQDFSGKVLH